MYPLVNDQSLTPFLVPLPSLENGTWDWKFQTSFHGLLFLVTSPPSRNLPLVRSLQQKMLLLLLSLKKLQGLQELYAGNQAKNQIYTSYYKSQYHTQSLPFFIFCFWRVTFLSLLKPSLLSIKMPVSLPYPTITPVFQASLLFQCNMHTRLSPRNFILQSPISWFSLTFEGLMLVFSKLSIHPELHGIWKCEELPSQT